MANDQAGFELSLNRMIDVSDPALPTLVWVQSTYVAAHDVAFEGGIAFLFSGGGDVEALDFTVPTNPVRGMRVKPTEGDPRYVVLSDGHLYFSNYNRLEIYDIQPMQFPPVTATLTVGSAGVLMATAPGRVYTLGSDIMGIIDAGSPPAPTWISLIQVATGTDPGGIQVVGDLVYVHMFEYDAIDEGMLAIVDVTDAGAPAIIGARNTRGGGGLAVADGYAWVAQADSTIAVFDVQNPASPVLIHEVAIQDAGLGVAQSSGYLYVAAGYSGLIILDVSEPSAPSHVTTLPPPPDGFMRAVTIAGGLAWVAGSMVTIVDIADPEFPEVLSVFFTCLTPVHPALWGVCFPPPAIWMWLLWGIISTPVITGAP
jgi:hypothetical protein